MKSIRLVGILLMVFVKNKLLSHITEVDAESVATGIMGLMVRKLARLTCILYKLIYKLFIQEMVTL